MKRLKIVLFVLVGFISFFVGYIRGFERRSLTLPPGAYITSVNITCLKGKEEIHIEYEDVFGKGGIFLIPIFRTPGDTAISCLEEAPFDSILPTPTIRKQARLKQPSQFN